MFKKIVLLSSLIIVLSGCDNSLEKNILGKWAHELTLPIDDGNMTGEGKLKCLSDYYPNKSATHNCDFLFSFKDNDGNRGTADFKLIGTGEWFLTDKTFYEKTIDGKMEFVKASCNGQEVSDK